MKITIERKTGWWYGSMEKIKVIVDGKIIYRMRHNEIYCIETDKPLVNLQIGSDYFVKSNSIEVTQDQHFVITTKPLVHIFYLVFLLVLTLYAFRGNISSMNLFATIFSFWSLYFLISVLVKGFYRVRQI